MLPHRKVVCAHAFSVQGSHSTLILSHCLQSQPLGNPLSSAMCAHPCSGLLSVRYNAQFTRTCAHMPSVSPNSARCRRWAQKCQTKGLTRVTVQVPAGDAGTIRAIAAQMREGALSSPAKPSGTPPQVPSWEKAFGDDWMNPAPGAMIHAWRFTDSVLDGAAGTCQTPHVGVKPDYGDKRLVE